MKKIFPGKWYFISFTIPSNNLNKFKGFVENYGLYLVIFFLAGISLSSFYEYLINGLGLSYNDARSHLDIGRRVVEGLKTGLAQLGSVWLPLNHILMVPLIWNDWMWHSGFAGAIWNMISYVGTGVVIYKFLQKLKVSLLGRFVGVTVFALNLNILYLQATAMTEPLLLFTMTAGCYYLMLWAYDGKLLDLIKSSAWIMLSTLVRYDGWFLLVFAAAIVAFNVFRKKGYKEAEGNLVLYLTLGSLGIFLWFLWNLLIFGDPLYFAFGPFSAHEQQSQLDVAGDLHTKNNLPLSVQIYFYALFYNSIATTALIGLFAGIYMLFDKKLKLDVRIASLSLVSPLIFNILALFLGFSVVFIQGISGDTWFNVRYGVMLLPSLAIYIGYLVDKLKDFKWILIGIIIFTTIFAFVSQDAVTIDDARVGASQKNVTEVSSWLKENTADKPGFVLISVASHDAIVFSSELPMKKFIHEGTGAYWEAATETPDKWARWIVMRTYDQNDLTYREIQGKPGLKYYNLVGSFPFADIYEIKPQYVEGLTTTPVFGRQKKSV